MIYYMSFMAVFTAALVWGSVRVPELNILVLAMGALISRIALDERWVTPWGLIIGALVFMLVLQILERLLRAWKHGRL
jgi:hypothetical protein